MFNMFCILYSFSFFKASKDFQKHFILMCLEIYIKKFVLSKKFTSTILITLLDKIVINFIPINE